MLKIKIAVCGIWTLFIVALLSCQTFSPVSSQTKETALLKNSGSKPENALISRFDKAIQQRFLTVEDFGFRRIAPPNPHLYQFSPINDAEKTSVADFEKDGWKVSLYLFGQHTSPKIADGKEQTEFTVSYHLNNPLPVTAKLPAEQLPSSKKLLKQIKSAFLSFQTPDNPNKNEYAFNIGNWSYVAKPVRAANESCLKCHTDCVMQGKAGTNSYTFRKREVGDTNGVIVYGFSKND